MAPPADRTSRRRDGAPAPGRPHRSPGARLLTGAAVVVALVGAAVLTACSSSTPVPADPTLAKGQEVFNTNCVACHGATGGGVTGPRLIGIGDRMTEEQEVAKITSGVSGTAMPAWGTRLSADEIAAVAAYTRSLTAPS